MANLQDDNKQQEDPFGMFGEDEDEEDDDSREDTNYNPNDNATTKTRRVATTMETTARRDPENGFNLYHPGTELAMLQYVRNGVTAEETTASAINGNSSTSTKIDTVLRLVDEFCMQRHWMMHIGTDKGNLLVGFLEQRIKQQQQPKPFLILEVGTYCGYSSGLLARKLLSLEKSSSSSSWHIITVDVDPLHIKVARQLHQLADLPVTSCFSYLLLDGTTPLTTRVQSELNQKFSSQTTTIPKIDFVFLDHDKDLYLQDLRHLEQAGLIRANCAVAADNVVFFRLHEYTMYMQRRAHMGIVTTQTVLGRVEYIPDDNDETDWQDGLELSVYLKDPPME